MGKKSGRSKKPISGGLTPEELARLAELPKTSEAKRISLVRPLGSLGTNFSGFFNQLERVLPGGRDSLVLPADLRVTMVSSFVISTIAANKQLPVDGVVEAFERKLASKGGSNRVFITLGTRVLPIDPIERRGQIFYGGIGLSFVGVDVSKAASAVRTFAEGHYGFYDRQKLPTRDLSLPVALAFAETVYFTEDKVEQVGELAARTLPPKTDAVLLPVTRFEEPGH